MSNHWVVDFLGTGAADWPIAVGDAVDRGRRQYCSILVNGTILIDCPAHVPGTLDKLGLAREQITDVFITHGHTDHCSRDALAELAESVPGELRCWGAEAVVASLGSIANLKVRSLAIGEVVEIADFTVEPLHANHDVDGAAGDKAGDGSVMALHYVIGRGDKQLFYGCDGAWLLKKTWTRLREMQLDAVIWDATIGDDYPGDYRICEHNDIAMVRLMTQAMRAQGIINDKTLVVLSHLARTLHPLPDEMPECLEPDGFMVAYDGMRVTM